MCFVVTVVNNFHLTPTSVINAGKQLHQILHRNNHSENNGIFVRLLSEVVLYGITRQDFSAAMQKVNKNIGTKQKLIRPKVQPIVLVNLPPGKTSTTSQIAMEIGLMKLRTHTKFVRHYTCN